MPLYEYRYTDPVGGTFDHFGRMTDKTLLEHEGRPCTRIISLPNVRTQYGAGSNTKPIEMMSIAVNNDQEIKEFRERNPGTEISSDRGSDLYGIPVVKSRSEKLRVLDKEGYIETN